MTALKWSQAFEWSVHYPAALRAGIDRTVADNIAHGRRPTRSGDDEAIVFRFVEELLQQQQVTDEAFGQVQRSFGERGVVDLTGIVAYYSFLAMQLSVARYPAPENAPSLPAIAP